MCFIYCHIKYNVLKKKYYTPCTLQGILLCSCEIIQLPFIFYRTPQPYIITLSEIK